MVGSGQSPDLADAHQIQKGDLGMLQTFKTVVAGAMCAALLAATGCGSAGTASTDRIAQADVMEDQAACDHCHHCSGEDAGGGASAPEQCGHEQCDHGQCGLAAHSHTGDDCGHAHCHHHEAGHSHTGHASCDHEHCDHGHHARPKDFGSGVAALQQYHATVRDSLEAGQIAKADEALHAAGNLLEVLPGLAEDAGLDSQTAASVRSAAEKMFVAYGQVDRAIHADEVPDYAAVADQLDQALAEITQALD